MMSLASLSLFLMGAISARGIAGSEPDPRGWTLRQWTEWRDEKIAWIFEPTLEDKGEKLLSRSEVFRRSAEAYRNVERILKTEPSFFEADPERKRELSRFARFLKAQHWMALKDGRGRNTHLLGFEIADADYWNFAAPFVQLPELLRSQEFLSLMSRPRGYGDAARMIESQNESLSDDRKWIVLPFLAQFILSVDRTTYGRMLVLVPNEPTPDGGVMDKWVQFAIATPDQKPVPEVMSVSVVAIHRPATSPLEAGAAEQREPGEGSRAHFMDYMRIRDPRKGFISLVPTMQLPEHPSKNCYDCHKAAAVPIHPELEFEFDKEGALVPKKRGGGQIPNLINGRIRGYGRANLGVLDTNAYGPSLAPVGRERTDQFIKDSAKGIVLSDASVGRVRSAMKCAGCHESFAPINYLEAVRSDRDLKGVKTKRGIAQTFVEKGWMPPNNDLTPEERKVLWCSVTREYFDPVTRTGVLIDWLKGRSP